MCSSSNLETDEREDFRAISQPLITLTPQFEEAHSPSATRNWETKYKAIAGNLLHFYRALNPYNSEPRSLFHAPSLLLSCAQTPRPQQLRALLLPLCYPSPTARRQSPTICMLPVQFVASIHMLGKGWVIPHDTCMYHSIRIGNVSWNQYRCAHGQRSSKRRDPAFAAEYDSVATCGTSLCANGRGGGWRRGGAHRERCEYVCAVRGAALQRPPQAPLRRTAAAYSSWLSS